MNGAGRARSIALAILTSVTACEFHHGQLDDARAPDAVVDAAIRSATLFVGDFGAGKLYRYAIGADTATPAMPLVLLLPGALSPLYMPKTGELLVTQVNTSVLQRVATPLTTPTLVGMVTGAGIGNQPQQMVLVDGEVWVVNPAAANIDRIMIDSTGAATMVGSIDNVLVGRGLAFDPVTRDLYVTECCGVDKILHYSIAADRKATSLPMADAPANPHGIAFAPWGEMFVVGAGSATVARFMRDASGALTPNGSISGNGLSIPVGIVLAPWGELYVANQGSNTISRFLLDTNHTAMANGTIVVPGGSSIAWETLVY